MSEFLKRKYLIIAALAMMIVLLSLPCFRSGIYEGHDIMFHLGRLQEIASELKKGQFPVRYEHDAWWGYGYISSTMYPNIFLYFPALLCMAGVPLYRAYNIYVIAINIATVLIAYYSFERIYKGDKWGLLATIIYCFSAYRFANVYRRTAVGEYTAMAFIPLLVYGFYHVYFEDEEENIFRRIAPIVISVFGVLESHMLTTEMLAMFILIFAVIYIRRTLQILKELFLALLIIVLTNAFFLVPFLSEYLTEKMAINTTISAFGVDGEGLYLSQFFKPFAEGRGSDLSWSAEHEEFLALGVALVLSVAAMAVVCIFYKKLILTARDKVAFKAALTMTGLGLIAAVLSTVYFPWGYFEKSDSFIATLMCSIQFPWRYLAIQTICFTVAGVYAMRTIYYKLRQYSLKKGVKKARLYYIGLVTVFTIIAVAQAGIFYRYLSLSCPTLTATYIDGWPGEYDSLYLLNGTDRHTVGDDLEVVYSGSTVSLPVFGYEHVKARDADGVEIPYTLGDNNRIVIAAADYSEDLNIDFEVPWLWRVAEIVTIISIVWYSSACIVRSRRNRL